MVYDDTVGKKVKSVALINKQSLLLVCLALCMNILFLYLYNPKVYFAITQAHGQIGYNFYRYNVIGMNSALTQQMNSLMREQGRLVDYDNVDLPQAVNYEPFPINDTVAYGLLLGFIWKLTGSLKFIDIQMLQIIIFSLLMLIYYQVAYMLFGCTQIAFCCGIAQLCFFPLLAYNVMPVRDVWAYYGLLVLCYAVLSYLFKQSNITASISCLIFFALCQWIRPTLSCALMMMTIFLVAYAVKKNNVRAFYLIGYMWFISILFFWLPFSYYNYTTYGRYMVSPAGQSLLEGLGELPNRWGHQLNDEYVNQFIGNKYNLVYGTIAFDEAAMQEFKQCVKEDPWHYIKTLLWRLPDVCLPGLQWIFYEQSPYAGCNGMAEKLICVFSSWQNIIDFVLRHIWMRLYLLCAYAGLVLLLMRKRYSAVAFILTCLVSGLSTYPSHIEYRYIVPFYWVTSLLAGFLVYGIIEFIFNKYYCKRLFMKKFSMLLLLMICAIQCNAMDEDLSKEVEGKEREYQEYCDLESAKAAARLVQVYKAVVHAYAELPDESKQEIRQEVRKVGSSLLGPLYPLITNFYSRMVDDKNIQAQSTENDVKLPDEDKQVIQDTEYALWKSYSKARLRTREERLIMSMSREDIDDISKKYRIVVEENYDIRKRNIEGYKDHIKGSH